MKKLSNKRKESNKDEINEGGITTGGKLNVIYEKIGYEPDFVINKMRVHFFFTEDGTNENFWKFLLNTEIELRITDGPYWEG